MATALAAKVIRELSGENVSQLLSLPDSRAIVITMTSHGIFFRPKSRGEKCEQFVAWVDIFKKGTQGFDQLRKDLRS